MRAKLYRYLGDHVWESVRISGDWDFPDCTAKMFTIYKSPGKKVRSYTTVINPMKTKDAYDVLKTRFNAKITQLKRKGWSEDMITDRKEKAMSFSNYKGNEDKITFPCYVSLKLDGIKLTYVSQGKFITKGGLQKNMGYTYRYEGVFENIRYPLEVELYREDLGIEEIKSYFDMRPQDLNMFAYDMVIPGMSVEDRHEFMTKIVTGITKRYSDFKISVVPMHKIENQEELDKMFDEVVAKGLEGLVIYNEGSVRTEGVSKDIFKRKPTFTDEFTVVGFTSDSDVDGDLIAFQCEAPGGVFKVVPNWTKEKRRNYWANKEDHWEEGMKLTVEHRGMTAKNIPKHARGLYFREDGV